MFTASNLPTLNAVFNGLSFVFLFSGYRFIKQGNRQAHKKCMIAALISSFLFLTSYLIYHYQVGSVAFTG
ncbi:MAG: DUF420 domain-containing protein, partial [Calditrichaeota bacterium]